MKDLEAVEAPSIPLTAPRTSSPRRSRATLILTTRTALVIVVCLGAYHYSLMALLHGLTMATPLACLGLVPLISLLLIAARARRAGDEPEIHDRYLDWIVGIPLVATALAIVWIAPIRLSTYFWLWRLDLLSLPLFVAGAVDLVFGARALWRLRVPIAFLALAWPVPYVLLANGGLGVLSVLAGAILKVARQTAAALPGAPPLESASIGAGALLSFLFVGLAVASIRYRASSTKTGPRPGRTCLAVPRAGIALGVLVVAGVLAGTANEGLVPFDQVATPLGQARLQPAAVASHPVPGWIVLKTDSYAWVTAYLGSNAGWDRYEYASGSDQPSASPPGWLSGITLDLFTTSDRDALSAYGIESAYHLRRYRLGETRPADLGGGVIAQSIIYRSRSTSETWTAVYWDWPVETAHGPGYERVVLNVTNPIDPGLHAGRGVKNVALLDGLRDGVVDALGLSRGGPATADERAVRDFMIGFARQVVLASSGRPA